MQAKPSLMLLESRICLNGPDWTANLPANIAEAYGLKEIHFTNPLTGSQIQGDGEGQIVVILNPKLGSGFGYDPTYHGTLHFVPQTNPDINPIIPNLGSNYDQYMGSGLDTFDKEFNIPGFGPPSPGMPFYLIAAPVSPNHYNPEEIPQGQLGDGAEFVLDVSYVHAMAPKASIIQLIGGNDENLAFLPSILRSLELNGYPVNHVSVLNLSYGTIMPIAEEGNQMGSWLELLQLPTSFVVSAGDNGAAYQTKVYVDSQGGQTFYNVYQPINSWGSQPGMILVGGTYGTDQELIDGNAKAWGDSTSSGFLADPNQNGIGGSGGGYSYLMESPDYQQTYLQLHDNSVPGDFRVYFESQGFTVDPYILPGEGFQPRLGPDISLLSGAKKSSSYVNIFANNIWQSQIGTSLSAPLFSGLLAVANQGRVSRGLQPLDGPTETLPMLYRAGSNLFQDVTEGQTNPPAPYLPGNGYPVGPGFDLVTGLGTPKGQGFVQYLAGATFQPWYAVAGQSTPGGETRIELRDSSNSNLLGQLTPFPGFNGPVSIAQGDVTGDLVPDLIVSAGAGGAPHVIAFNGLDLLQGATSPIASFLAFAPGFTGGTSVAVLPSLTGAPARIAVGAGPGAEPALAVFSPEGSLLSIGYAFDQAFKGGLAVSSGDLTGDGIFDIVCAAASGSSPHVVAFDGASGGLVASYLAFAQGYQGGLNLAVGDVNADGFADIAAGAARAWSTVNIYSPKTNKQLANFYAGDTPQSESGVRLALHDTKGLAIKDQLLTSLGEKLNSFDIGPGAAITLGITLETSLAWDIVAVA